MTKEFVSIQIGKIDRPQASGRLRHPRVHQNERIGVDVGDLLLLRRHHQKRPGNVKFDNLVIEKVA